MLYSNRPKPTGSIEIILVVIGVTLLIGGAVWYAVSHRGSSATNSSVDSPSQTTTKQPDSASTLESPSKIATKDGKQYFYYGAPAGQNNASPKRIIVSLPGHGTKAEDDYAAWLPHLMDGKYALASLNWWDGAGETKADYYAPADVQTQAAAFLSAQGYKNSDLIILEGFSRGSANTYAVIAHDRLSGNPVFDGVISASGGYQSDFALTDNQSNDSQSSALYKGVYWVLACGGLDPNPNRDGCPAMQATQTFLTAHGASVLKILEDPNSSHGAFHKGSLGLPAQALSLIESKAL